jgi:hypothetical protein
MKMLESIPPSFGMIYLKKLSIKIVKFRIKGTMLFNYSRHIQAHRNLYRLYQSFLILYFKGVTNVPKEVLCI